jgi:DcaP outer membrane protein
MRTITIAALLAIAPVSLAAQTQPAPPASAPDVATLARLVEEQRQLLAEQHRVIEDLNKRLEETAATAASSERRLLALEQRGAVAPPPAAAEPVAAAQPVAAAEQPVRNLPELAKGIDESSDFTGAFRVPGTEAAIRFSGQVRTIVVRSFGAVGTDDRFVTSSIAVAGSPEAGKTSRTTLSASPSRIETDLRTPTRLGAMRAFVSGDFAGDGRTYRLRHAFGQWRGFTIGQTWSTFSDPEAEPDGIDFEGLNAISLFRQPIIRWTRPLSKRFEFAAAIENPAPDLTGATGVNQIPDLVVRLRWEPRTRLLLGRGGHTQVALLVRQIRGSAGDNANETLSTGGVGLHVSGRVPTPWLPRDYVKFATAGGTGIGRYITDLGSVGGQDAVFDAEAATLRALRVFSSYVGYEHWWTETLRSTGTFGLVAVDNLDIQALDALRRTTRTSFNIAWSPITRVDLVAEFLTGRRVDRDGSDGTAGQFQVGWIFRF